MGGMSPRRRSTSADPLEKTGYRLPRSVVMRVREAVDAGEAASQNELVERALRRELRAIRRRRLEDEYAAAAADPDYLAAMREVDSDWDATVADGLEEEDG
jgi:Arc/MetJ-type ribon-helix-helix transcriptional regulator